MTSIPRNNNNNNNIKITCDLLTNFLYSSDLLFINKLPKITILEYTIFIRKMIDLQHHHNNCTTPPHMGVGPCV
jgi:hypothetical protein